MASPAWVINGNTISTSGFVTIQESLGVVGTAVCATAQTPLIALGPAVGNAVFLSGSLRGLVIEAPNVTALGGSPLYLLTLTANGPNTLGPVLTLTNSAGGSGAGAAIHFNTFQPATSGVYNPSACIEAQDGGSWANDLVFQTNRPGAPNNGLVEAMRINGAGNVGIGGLVEPVQKLTVCGAESSADGFAAALGISNAAPGGRNWYFRAGATGTNTPAGGISIADDTTYRVAIDGAGNVGIGTTSPASRLHVSGDVTVTGDVLLPGEDCAEEFDSAGERQPEPGTVVVIDEDEALRESQTAYDKRVAGVVSGAGLYRHALVLGRRLSGCARIPVALAGKVYCKVDASYSPIEVGDLLTTSPTEGHAMKAVDPFRAFGCVIGKALKPLREGQGLIPILVALQ